MLLIAGRNGPEIEIVGRGNWAHWQFPATATYTAVPIDDRTVLSSFSAPGNLLSVSLPEPGAVRAGWSMGFASDNGKGIIVEPASGSILAGGKALPSLTLGPGDYEYAELVSMGSQYRLTSATGTHGPRTVSKAATGPETGCSDK